MQADKKMPDWFDRGFISKGKYQKMDDFEKARHLMKMSIYKLLVAFVVGSFIFLLLSRLLPYGPSI